MGSNFHQLRFRSGQCIRVIDHGAFGKETHVYDSTPDWAKPEVENLVNKTILQKEIKRQLNWLKQ